MCQLTVSIALCAPKEPPASSFTCGRLHLISGDYKVCNKAAGPCICFIGTCGSLAKATPTACVELTELPKVRCLQCTKKEDETGEKRTGLELLESRLLEKFAVPAKGLDHYITLLRAVWGHRTCPFHGEINAANEEVPEETKLETEKHETTDKETDASYAAEAIHEYPEKEDKEPSERSIVNETVTESPIRTNALAERDPNEIREGPATTVNNTASESLDAEKLDTPVANGLDRSMWAGTDENAAPVGGTSPQTPSSVPMRPRFPNPYPAPSPLSVPQMTTAKKFLHRG